MFKHRGIIFVAGLAVGAAAVLLFRERKAAEIPLTPTKEETVSPAPIPISAAADRELLELARLRGEVTRLRRENSELQQRASSAPRAMDHSAPTERRPTFMFSFVTRDTWTNVGLATPQAAIQTFFSAFANGDEELLARISALQTNGEPYALTGMSTDWAEQVMGAQILEIALPDPRNFGVAHAKILTETRTLTEPAGEMLSHSVMTFRLHNENGEWRFAGRVR